MASYIVDSHFNPWQAIQQYQAEFNLEKQFGATATFVGTMRDVNEDDDISAMTLEHYPEMTQRYLEKLEQEAKQQWLALLDSLIIHRIGEINPADPLVLIACWSAHRRPALDATSWLIESLKTQAPFWKKEIKKDGAQWVEKNTDGY